MEESMCLPYNPVVIGFKRLHVYTSIELNEIFHGIERDGVDFKYAGKNSRSSANS